MSILRTWKKCFKNNRSVLQPVGSSEWFKKFPQSRITELNNRNATILNRSLSDDVIKVLINRQFEELADAIDSKINYFDAITKKEIPVTPPFAEMWLEYTPHSEAIAKHGSKTTTYLKRMGVLEDEKVQVAIGSTGCYLSRTPIESGGWEISMDFFEMNSGEIGWSGSTRLRITQEGVPLPPWGSSLLQDWMGSNGFSQSAFPNPDVCINDSFTVHQVNSLVVKSQLVGFALSMFHCPNMRMVTTDKEFKSTTSPKVQRPGIFWHVIDIDYDKTPQKIRTGSSSHREDYEILRMVRVRGHYSDYRKGAGAFGNPNLRKLFWIPEHKRGDENHGTTNILYAVKV